MTKLYHARRIQRSTFKKLAFGQPFWTTSTGTQIEPNIKNSRTAHLGGRDPATFAQQFTTESPTTEIVYKPDRRMLYPGKV